MTTTTACCLSRHCDQRRSACQCLKCKYVFRIRFDRMGSSFCRLVCTNSEHWPASPTDFSTKVNILDIWTLLGLCLCAWPAYRALLWLFSVWDMLRMPKQGPYRAQNVWRGRFDRFCFRGIRGLFIPLIWTVKVPYQAREWPSCVSSLMIRAFQTGDGSYATWMCLQYVIKYQNHFDTSQFQMWLMPFPIYFNALSSFFFGTNLIPIASFSVGSPGPSQTFWGTSQTSDFIRSFFEPLRAF